MRRSLSVLLGSLLSITVLLAGATPSWAYPFWAQQNYASPREATGKIVCANCHLAKKATRVEVPQAIFPDTVFKAEVEIPYDTSVQQVGGDGNPTGLNVGAVVMLPEVSRTIWTLVSWRSTSGGLNVTGCARKRIATASRPAGRQFAARIRPRPNQPRAGRAWSNGRATRGPGRTHS